MLLGRAHVGPLLDQLRGHTDRQIGRQLQIGEPERLARSFARIDPGESRQQVALLRERLAQRRQRRLGLGERGFLRGEIAAVAQAFFQPLAEGIGILLLMAMSWLVASICPRSEASVIAATTIFAVSAR